MTGYDYRASCPQCGSLGNYTRQDDANNAELQHQVNSHPAQLYADPPPVEATRENRFKPGPGRGGKKEGR